LENKLILGLPRFAYTHEHAFLFINMNYEPKLLKLIETSALLAEVEHLKMRLVALSNVRL
jgi:hypothetical protein